MTENLTNGIEGDFAYSMCHQLAEPVETAFELLGTGDSVEFDFSDDDGGPATKFGRILVSRDGDEITIKVSEPGRTDFDSWRMIDGV